MRELNPTLSDRRFTGVGYDEEQMMLPSRGRERIRKQESSPIEHSTACSREFSPLSARKPSMTFNGQQSVSGRSCLISSFRRFSKVSAIHQERNASRAAAFSRFHFEGSDVATLFRTAIHICLPVAQ